VRKMRFEVIKAEKTGQEEFFDVMLVEDSIDSFVVWRAPSKVSADLCADSLNKIIRAYSSCCSDNRTTRLHYKIDDLLRVVIR